MKRTLALLILAVAVPALARDNDARDRFGRIRYREGGVTLQRADEGAAEVADPNLPFLPGDRLWTDGSGRVEIQFDDGTILRLDAASKLDFAGTGRRSEIALKLWAGSLFLHARRQAESFELDTPGGLLSPREEGVYRIDVNGNQIRVSVFRGSLSLDSGQRRIIVADGEQVYSRWGEDPEGPDDFDTRDADNFASWDGEREDRLAWAGDSRRYLSEEVEPYAYDLESNGSWYFEADIGHVWRPQVDIGWRPYSSGRWIWTYYGWTWVPEEPWGWATYHYGRWGHSYTLGWYWIPGNVWGPAWVHWAIGSDHVGWCPLGRHDRPVDVQPRGRGHAGPRGNATVADVASSQAWVFARRADLTTRDLARRRIDATPAQLRDVRMLESTDLRPSRDLRMAESRAVARERAPIKTRPTLGELVPELRSNPSTTPPYAWPRATEERRDQRNDQGRAYGSTNQATRRDWSARPRAGDSRTTPSTADTPTGSATARWREMDRTPRRSVPETDSSRTRSIDPSKLGRTPSERERSRDSSSSESAKQSRSRANDGVNDVLRRFFQPVNEPRRDRGGDSDRGLSRSEPRARESRPAPREVSPRVSPKQSAPPSTSSRGATAKPREKHKN